MTKPWMGGTTIGSRIVALNATLGTAEPTPFIEYRVTALLLAGAALALLVVSFAG